MKKDIREYSENELSMLVFNDEGLYRMRRRSYLIEVLRDNFIFTDEQLEVLEKDLREEERGE